MKRPLAIFATAMWILLLARPGLAAPVTTADGDDSAGALDVAELTHDHSDTEITYTLETQDADPYPAAGTAPATATWSLDFNGDDTVDVCVSADLDTEASLTANLLDGTCAAGSDIGDADVTLATNIFTVVVTRADIDAVTEVSGDTDDIYEYRVATESNPTAPDAVPDAAADTIEHDLAGAAASPSPSPSVEPSASPTTTDDPVTTTATDPPTTVAGADESAVLPAGGDTVDTAAKAWPSFVGVLLVCVALVLGATLAYRLTVKRER